jgi:Tol biopolymer transport system component
MLLRLRVEQCPASRLALMALAVATCVGVSGMPNDCRAQVAARQDRPKPANQGRIVAYVDKFAPTVLDPGGISGMIVIDPENDTWRVVSDGEGGSLSRDGKRLAYVRITSEGEIELWLRALDGGDAPKRLAENASYPCWSPDGTQIVFATFVGTAATRTYESWRMNADGSNRTRLALFENELPQDWSPDGEWLAIASREVVTRPYPSNIALIHPDGTGRRPLTEGDGWHSAASFSPDGRRILFVESIRGEMKTISNLIAMDIDGQNRRRIPLDREAGIHRACWSPDGERLAVSVNDPAAANRFTIEIWDNNGKNRRVLPLPAGLVILMDWR